MAEPNVAERARAPERAHALEEPQVAEPVVETAAPAGTSALRLAGAGVAAGDAPPPWMGSDRGTTASVLHTIQRTAGNRAAVQLLAQHRGPTPPVAQRAGGGGVAEREDRSPVLDVVGKGGGSTLDDATRVSMEEKFGGADFRDVRVHTGEAASRSAASVGADAFTVGSDIVVRDGNLSQHTLAHELAHVEQQRAGPVDGTDAGGGVRVSDPSDRFEQAAEQVAQRIGSSSGPVAEAPAASAGPAASLDDEAPIQRLVKAPEQTSVVPVAGRKPPGAGNAELASAIRRWGEPGEDKAAEPAKTDVLDAVAGGGGGPAGEAVAGDGAGGAGAPGGAGAGGAAGGAAGAGAVGGAAGAGAAAPPPGTALESILLTTQGAIEVDPRAAAAAPRAGQGTPGARAGGVGAAPTSAPTTTPAPLPGGGAATPAPAQATGAPAPGPAPTPVAGAAPAPTPVGGAAPAPAPASTPPAGTALESLLLTTSGVTEVDPRATPPRASANGATSGTTPTAPAVAEPAPPPGAASVPATPATQAGGAATGGATTTAGGQAGAGAPAPGGARADAPAGTRLESLLLTPTGVTETAAGPPPAAPATGAAPTPAASPGGAAPALAPAGTAPAAQPPAGTRLESLLLTATGVTETAAGSQAAPAATGGAGTATPGAAPATPGAAPTGAAGTTPTPTPTPAPAPDPAGVTTTQVAPTPEPAGAAIQAPADQPSPRAAHTAAAPGTAPAPQGGATPAPPAGTELESLRYGADGSLSEVDPHAPPAGGRARRARDRARTRAAATSAATGAAGATPAAPTPAAPTPDAPGAAPGAAPAGPAGTVAPNGVINMEPLVITASPPGGPGASTPVTGAPTAAPATTPGVDPAVSTGFKEKAKPVAKGVAAPKGGPAGAAKGGGAKKGGGGGGGAPKPVPLGDAALESWRSASKSAVAATKPGDLGEAKDAPAKLEAKGKEVDAARKSAEPDYQAEAKSKTPPMPKEPAKAETLNTGPADAAVESLKQAGTKRLKEQSLEPVGAPPAYKDLNPRDYVPKNLLTAITSLEAELARKDLKPGEKEKLTKQLEAKKAAVAEIEKTGGKGTPPASPTVTDKGPASLEPVSPAQANVLGDAIARAIGQIDAKAAQIKDKAVGILKGDEVPALKALATDEEAGVKAELDKELRGIASAAGVTEEQLKAKITEQQQAVKDEAAAVEKGLAASSATANKQTEQRKQDADGKAAGARENADAETKAKEDALQGPPDTAAIEKKRDEYITKVQDVGAQALAGYTSSLTKRESDLDQAATTQKAAVKQAADNQAAAIRRHWADSTEPDKASLEALPTTDWGRSRSAQVDAEVRKLKAASRTEKESFDAGVATTLTSSKDAIRDWAAAQQGTERSWWDRLMDMISDWRTQSTANTAAWEKQRNADSRDQMMGDLDTLTKLREAQATNNQEAMNKEFMRLDADQKQLALTFFKGGMSSIEFVAQSTMNRIGNRRAPELATSMEQKAIAGWDWMALGQLARGKNPSFNPSVLANKVRGGVAGWGTNESQVYAGLGGAKTAVERAALAKCYEALFHVSMEADVKDDMEDHELERAKALMEGKGAEADAATIKEAIAGMGTDEQAIRDALRGKSPEELEAIKAEYKRMYGVELKTDISGDMEDAEADNALALADGDVDKADAAELEDAMAGAGTNEEKLQKVYERIREEEEARARKDGITPAELKQRILDRNARVKGKFAEKYGDLDAKLQDELLDGEARPKPGSRHAAVDDSDLKVLDALQTGDPSKIDAAKAYREHKGVYASDDELEKIVRNQRRQAELDVALEMKSDRQKLDALKASGDISEADYKAKSEALDKAAKDKDGVEKRIAGKAGDNMGALKTQYSKATDGRQTFDNLIKYETSGYSKDEIQELVTAGGKLSDAQELYYATKGAGTDEDKIKEVLKGKTPKEIAEIKRKYAELHDGASLEDDILEDLSGREDLDVGHTLKYGDPETFARQIEEEKDPVKRKALIDGMKAMLQERKAFEETGAIGGAMATGEAFGLGGDPMNSAEQMEEAVRRADLYEKALAANEEKNRGKKPEDIEPDPLLAAAKANFEMTYGGTIEAQEQVRAQIDAYADVITQVGAAIAGIAVTVATFGAAGPVVAALYGAAAAAAMTMALKAHLKGAAYSWEEAGVDLVVGAIDATVSGLTAGMGKAVTGAISNAVAKQVAKKAAQAAAKEGAKEVSESVVKVWIKEAFEEVIENAVQAMPSAAAQAMLDDNTWKGGDPFGNIVKATGTAAAMGAGIGVAAKGATDLGGAAIGKIRGKGKAGADVDVKAGGDAPAPPKVEGDTAAPKVGEAAPPPEPKPLDLPAEAAPNAAATKADAGELPPGAAGKDVTKGGELPASAGPDPKPGEARAGQPEPGGSPGRKVTEDPNAPKGTAADGQPHTKLDDAEITEFPEGSVGMLPEAQAKDRSANKEFFDKWHESDPGRETALLRNETTGEYVVVQGGAKGVELGKENPRWAEELLTPAQRNSGKWIFEAHSHPIDATTKVTPDHARWPSGGGKGSDFHGVAVEAKRTGKAVSEEIRYIGDKGPETLTYGYDPARDKPFFVEKPGPDGTMQRHEYSNIDEYHADYKKQFGNEPSANGVADDFPGPRDDFLHEAPTLKPGELEAAGVGRGSTPDPSAIKPRDAGAVPVDKAPDAGTAKRAGPSVDDAGKPLSRQDLAERYGMPDANVKKIVAVCEAKGIVVDIRPTTPHAEVMLREGTALPKHEKIKAKTINETDVQIGLGKPEDLGKVGFFDPAKVEPKRPANYDSLDDAAKKKIDDRIKQRLEEFNDFKGDMEALQQAGKIRVEPDGTIVNTGLIKNGGEKPFTGDHDIFDIRKADGSPLTREEYQAAVKALKEADAGVMHGGVTGWELDAPETFDTPAGRKSYQGMVDAHSPGGKEPLVRLGAGEPKATWYEPPKAPDVKAAEAARVPTKAQQDALPPRSGKQPTPPPNPADQAEIDRLTQSQARDMARGGDADFRRRPMEVVDVPDASPTVPPRPDADLMAGRPDAQARMAEMDTAHTDAGKTGPAPSQRFDAAVAKLEAAGMGESGRAKVGELLDKAKGQPEVSNNRLKEAIKTVEDTAALLGVRPDLGTPKGQARMLDNLRASKAELEAATAQGKSMNGFDLKSSKHVKDTLDDLDAAFKAFDASKTGDPVGDLMKLVDLQEQLGKSINAIRNQADIFDVMVTPGTPQASKRFKGLMETPIEVSAAGKVTESLGRGLPGGSKEAQVLTPRQIGDLKTAPPGLAAQLERQLANHHRAHLIGPGFGAEARPGIMLAPAHVNLDLQNKGVESFIRSFPNNGRDVNLVATAKGQRIEIPLQDGTFRTVDVLSEVKYEIIVPGQGTFEVTIEIPARGRPKVTSTIPADAPGAQMLQRTGRAAGRQRRRGSA